MKQVPWQVRFGLILVCCSGAVYLAKIILIDNVKGTIEYIFNSLGFLFINVMMVTLVINELLSRRSRRERMEKMNMVIGTFFSETGSGLLGLLNSGDPMREEINNRILQGIRNGEDFPVMKKAVLDHSFRYTPVPNEIEGIYQYLQKRRDFHLRLLENPVLLEHQSFTSLLQATFHLTEELSRRGSFTDLPDPDYAHLAGDISRVYRLLAGEWIRYLDYLNRNYPYLYSLAVRTNPFDPAASVIIS